MTEQEYNAAEGVRRSDLWKMNDSPEKYRYYLDNPVEQTPAMTFGSACHKLILEPASFGDEYAIAPVGIDRRTKAGKEQWETFLADNAGKTVIGADDAECMRGMEEAIAKCSLAADLVRGDGETEVPFFWEDQDTGEACKVKLDRLIKGLDGRYYVVDYKTTQCAETERFNHDIFRLGYYMQAAMYTEGVMHGLNLDYRPTFLFVAQEKKAPYSVNVIEVSEDVMKVGLAKFHELLGRLHDCKAVDMWPGYVEDVPNETQLPGWWSLEGEE